MTRNGAAFELPTSERLISGSGCSSPPTLLATPRASSANGPSSAEIAANDPKRRLETQVALLPTPMTSDRYNAHRTRDQLRERVLTMLPTAASRDHKDGTRQDVPINGLLGRAVWDLAEL